MKLKFRILKKVTHNLKEDNETVTERVDYYIQQKSCFLFGWESFGECALGWRWFDSEEEAMKYLLDGLREWWEEYLDLRKRKEAKKRLKDQLKSTTIVIGTYTFNEEALNKLISEKA